MILSLNGSDSPDPAVPGGRITYTLTYANSSITETARGIILKNILPPEMTFVAASDEGTEMAGVAPTR